MALLLHMSTAVSNALGCKRNIKSPDSKEYLRTIIIQLPSLFHFLISWTEICIHSFLRPFIPLSIPSFLCSFICSFLWSFIPSSIHSFIRSFLRPFNPSFSHSFPLCSLIYLFIRGSGWKSPWTFTAAEYHILFALAVIIHTNENSCTILVHLAFANEMRSLKCYGSLQCHEELIIISRTKA